jgi:hypothetical protein
LPCGNHIERLKTVEIRAENLPTRTEVVAARNWARLSTVVSGVAGALVIGAIIALLRELANKGFSP